MLLVLFLVSVSPVSLAHAQTLSNPPYGQNQTINRNRRLRVERAIYGRQGKGTDVTGRVKSMIRNDALQLQSEQY
jgi:hypothetical protein